MKTNIYISISNLWRVHLSQVIELAKDYFNLDCTYFQGGTYTDRGIKENDIFILFVPKNDIIGKGAYCELQVAEYLQKEIYFYKEGILYTYANVKTISNSDNWNNYARISSISNEFKKEINREYLLLI